MKRLTRLILLLIVGLFGIWGCSSKSVVEVGSTKGAPLWVAKGSGAFEEDKEKVFYGVGSAANISNHSLLRTAADNRARNEISKIFEVYTASIMKDYMASRTAGNPNVSSEEQDVEQAIKTVTSSTLAGAVIVDHWKDPATGELFSLAKLDLNALKETLDKAKELTPQARDYIRKNADRLHDQLEKEEEKRGK